MLASPTIAKITAVTPAATLKPAVTPKSGFKDGSYAGPATDPYYGNVQAQAVIVSGQLTDVKFLQYPNDRRTSQQISMNAMPILKSEAIKSQSANVDIVSGATQTSEAFRKSLAAALAQAAN